MSNPDDMSVDDFFNDMIKNDQKKLQDMKQMLGSQERAVKQHNMVLHEKLPQQQPNFEQPSSNIELGTAQEVLQNLQRDINCLSSNDRFVRKNALEKIRSVVNQCKTTNRVDVMAHIYSHLDQPVLNLFHDQVEAVRENACALMLDFLTHLTAPELGDSYSIIVPTLHTRLTSKRENEKWTEPSEEVRIILNLLLNVTVEKFGEAIGHAHYTDSIVQCLKSSFTDFHGIIKEACSTSITICNKLPEKTHYFASNLIKSLRPNLTHNRSEVRVAALHAIENLMLHCRGNDVPMEDLDPLLHNIIMTDQSIPVRDALIDLASRWIQDWIEYFSFRYQIIFYCLVGLSDDVESIRHKSISALRSAGKIFIKDNEKEYEEMCEFERLHPQPKSDDPIYAVIGGRPPLECRMLVRDVANVKKCVAKLLADLFDWTIRKRRSASRTLYILLLFTEEYITQHLQILVPNYFQVCEDDEPSVREETLNGAVELTGRFVTPESYLALISAYLRPQYAASPNKLVHTLTVFSHLIRGLSHRVGNTALLRSFLSAAYQELSQTHLLNSENLQVRSAVLLCLEAIACNEIMSSYLTVDRQQAANYFYLLVTLCAQPSPSGSNDIYKELIRRGKHALESLARSCNLDNVEQLYDLHFDSVLDQVLVDLHIWDKTNPHMYTFQALVNNSAGSTIARYLDDNSRFIDVFLRHNTFMDTNKLVGDPIVSMTLFAVLNRLLAEHGPIISQHPYFLNKILHEVIAPHLVWRSGKMSSEFRKLAMACLSCLLRQRMVHGESVANLAPHIISAVEEDEPHVRTIASMLLGDFIEITAQFYDSILYFDILHKSLT